MVSTSNKRRGASAYAPDPTIMVRGSVVRFFFGIPNASNTNTSSKSLPNRAAGVRWFVKRGVHGVIYLANAFVPMYPIVLLDHTCLLIC